MIIVQAFGRVVVIQRLNLAVRRVSRDMISGMLQDLRNETPKDTGRAAAGWQPLGPTGVFVGTDFGGIGGITGIINEVPYIPLLNAGHSRQAPPGFVDNIVRRHMILQNARQFS